MQHILALVFLIVALVLFTIAAFPPSSTRVQNAGLAFLAAGILLTQPLPA